MTTMEADAIEYLNAGTMSKSEQSGLGQHSSEYTKHVGNR